MFIWRIIKEKEPLYVCEEMENTMADKPLVTNAMRLLKSAGIEYEVRTYEVDENDLSGVSVAQKVGLPPEEVFKTLVLCGEKKGVMVCVVPVELEIDLKKLAQAAGDKKVEMVAMKELLPLTGYIRGGCSPIGMKKKYATYIDETCLLAERIAVSAGVRGAQVIVNTEQLIAYTEAVVCEVT